MTTSVHPGRLIMRSADGAGDQGVVDDEHWPVGVLGEAAPNWAMPWRRSAEGLEAR